MLIKLAIKNLFRNKKRTLLSALSIFFAATIVIFGYGWVYGVINNSVNSYQNFQSGTIRIMLEDYAMQEKFLPVDIFMDNADKIKQELNAYLKKKYSKVVFEFAERIKCAGLAGKGEYSGPVVMLGLDVEAENKRFQLDKNIVEGSYTLGTKEILIGMQLAKNLHASVGDSLLIATKTYVSGLNANKFIIRGIVDFSVESLNKSFVIANIEDVKFLLKLSPEAMTELLIFFDRKYLENVREMSTLILKGINNKILVRSYKEDMGAFGRTLDMIAAIVYIFFAIIVFLASFVIINSMMMNIFERINEIGTLKAQGMFDREIFHLHFIEGAIMGILGGIPGTLAGFAVSYYISLKGVDMGQVFKNTNFFVESVIYTDASATALVSCLILSIIIPAIATLLPSNYARKLNPVEALRKI